MYHCLRTGQSAPSFHPRNAASSSGYGLKFPSIVNSLIFVDIGVGEWEPDISPPASVRVWCPDLLHENNWCHIFFSFSPSHNHPFTIYINGRSAHSCKLEYPHRSKGASYSAFIGTPPCWRKLSKLTWRQGVCHLFEDWVPNAVTVAAIWKLGPENPGSWQSVKTASGRFMGPNITKIKNRLLK